MSLLLSSDVWGQEDGAAMEGILSEVSEDSVPRIGQALVLLGKALAKGEAVALEPTDAVLTDALRCILSHRWLLPSVQQKDASGKMVASFFTQPFRESGQVLSLFSSAKSFSKLQRLASESGLNLTPVPFSFGQVIMAHLPNMSLEALQERGIPALQAVCAISLDPLTLDLSEEDALVFSEPTFPILRSFCYCYLLAGQVLQLQEDLELGVECNWEEVLCNQSLHAIFTSKDEADSVFASEDGMLLFVYPGDASKVLSYHQRKGTAGLKNGRVVDVDPARFLHLMRWQAKEGKKSLIVATVMQPGDLQLHGLSIMPDVYLKTIEPSLSNLNGTS